MILQRVGAHQRPSNYQFCQSCELKGALTGNELRFQADEDLQTGKWACPAHCDGERDERVPLGVVLGVPAGAGRGFLTWLRLRISYLKQAFFLGVRLGCALLHEAYFPVGFSGESVSNRKQKVS